MKKDYPKANARLAEVAKNWADGEVSHEAWRKERRSIIKALKEGKDWLANEAAEVPKRIINASRATLPVIPVPPVLSPHGSFAGAGVMMESQEMVHEDALLLAVLLLVMMMTAILLLYIV